MEFRIRFVDRGFRAQVMARVMKPMVKRQFAKMQANLDRAMASRDASEAGLVRLPRRDRERQERVAGGKLDAVHARLAVGLRRLDAEGRPTTEPVTGEELGQVPGLLVVDLEMSGPNASMHEVLDNGGVRADIAEGLPEQQAWGARVKPRHIGNAVPAALKVSATHPNSGARPSNSETPWTGSSSSVCVIPAIAGLGDWPGHGVPRRDVPAAWAAVALRAGRGGRAAARQLLKGSGQADRFNLGHVAHPLGIGRMGRTRPHSPTPMRPTTSS